MVPFAGWEMPIQYGSILDEARAVRSGSGVFDVSHMGRVEIGGPGAAGVLDRVLSIDAPGMRIGRAKYNVICNEDGGIIDDCIVYRRGEDQFLLIPNASNRAAVVEWIWRWVADADEERVTIDDVTDRYAMIAHQGPRAIEMLEEAAGRSFSELKPFAAVDARMAGVDVFLGRTGYTGEDGVEIIAPRESAPDVWNMLLGVGARACGLGARDVLRLEAGLLLHGNDMDASVNPYEAGLHRFVDPDREGYVAGDALRRVRGGGVERRLAGFTVLGRGIARQGYPILHGGEQVGLVTSGGPSPTLDRNIGLGYVPIGLAAPGTRLQVDVRGRTVEAEVTALPFYSRRRAA